ncbi:MAG: AMP-binding protein [Candidimonas sp.]|nr:AMP-binding protein [Candidimonas sp.]
MQPIDFFLRGARLHPTRCAVIDAESGSSLTHHQLLQQTYALAAGLRALSAKPRPVVAILAGNSIDMLLGILATYACSGVIVPLTPSVQADIARQLDSAQPDVVLFDPVYEELLVSYGGPRVAVAPGFGSASVQSLLDRHAGARLERPLVDLAETVAIKFTGGSSGVPKAVLQSFRCINTMVASLMMVYGFNEEERFVVAPPMTHGAGTFVLPVLGQGGCLVLLQKPTAENLHATLHRHAATSTWLPPTLLYKLLEVQKRRALRFSSLRNLLYGGAPCPMALIEDTIAEFGPVVGATYGLTEAPVAAAAMAGAEGSLPENRGSAGRIGPLASVAVLKDDGQISLMPGEQGELVIGGDLLMSGYLGMPEQTAAVIKDGWFRTGDIGYVDERGFVFIKGRSKDVIITGGFNVHPSDVEAVYSRHDAVAECLVFGVPDELWGERVEIAVVLTSAEEADAARLIAFGKQHLGSVRTPKGIHFLDHFPKNELGKINKRQIVERLIASDIKVEN